MKRSLLRRYLPGQFEPLFQVLRSLQDKTWRSKLGTLLMNLPSGLLRSLIAALLITVATRHVGVEAAEPSGFGDVVQPFLAQYCVNCHGATQQKGDRRFDALSGEIADDNAAVDLQDILDQINLGEMPPKESKQPAVVERRQVTEWLTQQIAAFHRQRRSIGADTVLRRLNAREYRNTIRDLLQLNMTMFDPTAGFPRDQTSEHLDNVGDALVTSGYLLQKYLDAAELAVGKALTPRARPEIQKWVFRDGFHQQPEIDQVFKTVSEFKYLTLFDVTGADKQEGAYGPLHAFSEGVPHDGVYELRFQAEAVNRINPYDAEFLGTDPSEPLRLGVVAGNSRVGALYKPQPIEPLLAELELADEPKWYTVRVWLDQGFSPRFTFRNGLMDVRSLWNRLLRKYPDLHPQPDRPGIVGDRYTAIQFGKLPQIRVHEVEIEGPFLDEWPTADHRAVLGADAESILNSGSLSEEQARSLLTDFATRAYRRPARAEEVERLMQVFIVRRETDHSALDAFGDALKAALCSPVFLYLAEPSDQPTRKPDSEPDSEPGEKPLDHWGLAARLSYFLWSSMPDRELGELAARQELHRPEILAAQVDRMLADARSDALIDGFTGSWLTLQDLGSMPPDRSRFSDFYRYDLDTAMRRETHLFVRRLIDENLSVVAFLDSDFTYVNKPLARLYGLDPPVGNGFELVRLVDRRRGGLLGQASVLTVTANGIDTSPVVRGVWLLENILGTPPSPPPPDVEPLDPDIRGAVTIREQLQKHRNTPNCLDCHRKIDPLGFALENFDPVGGWRDTYSNRSKIDSSGELPSGQTFDGISNFKRLLVERRELFIRALTSKLLAYATGRHTEPTDRPGIDRIVQELNARGDGLRDLIKLIAQSEQFQSF